MSTAANFGLHRTSRLRAFASLNRTWVVSILFGAVIAVQGLGFLVLGTDRQAVAFPNPSSCCRA